MCWCAQTHIACSSTLPYRNVEELRAAANGRLLDIDTGHDQMIAEPEAVAEMLLLLA